MARKLSPEDRTNLWRWLQRQAPGQPSIARLPDPNEAPVSPTGEAAKLRATVDVRTGIGLMLLALVMLVVLVLLPPRPLKWVFYVTDAIFAFRGAWLIDRGNRRLRKLLRQLQTPPG